MGVLFVRYGIGSILVAVGVALLIVSPGGFGVEGFGLSAGAGLSVLMLNFLYRLGVAGDAERRREEAARSYLLTHGHWPDDRRPDTASAGQTAASAAGPAPERRIPPAEAAAAANAARRKDAGPERQPDAAGEVTNPGTPGRGTDDHLPAPDTAYGEHASRRQAGARDWNRRRRRGPG
jgi:hypothetical protein